MVATNGKDATRLLNPDAVLGHLANVMISAARRFEFEELERRLEGTLADAETWRNQYEWLRNRWPIRAAASLKRIVSGPFRRES